MCNKNEWMKTSKKFNMKLQNKEQLKCKVALTDDSQVKSLKYVLKYKTV